MIASDDKTCVVEGNLVFGHTLMDRFRLDQFEGDVWSIVVVEFSVRGAIPLSSEILSSHRYF